MPQIVAGQTYGFLTAESPTSNGPRGHRRWQFRCRCGNVVAKRVGHVLSGAVQACGCLRLERAQASSRERTGISPGDVFHRLTAVEFAGVRGKVTRWLWLCECGSRPVISAQKVKRGHTRSCGCLQAESRLTANRTHGHTVGRTKSKEHLAWSGMRQRCYNPRNNSYSDYGGRGVTVCDRWKDSFENFLADMGPAPSADHTVERVKVELPYSPDNCVWLPKAMQADNRRNSVLVEHGGETHSVAEWSRRTGIRQATIRGRLALGWPPERVLTTPQPVTTKRPPVSPEARAKRIWKSMIDRCHNPAATGYPRYGGEGVTVCDRWRESFPAFLADVGPPPTAGHSLDRRDGTRGYEPDNCRWQTRVEQANNRKDNVTLTHDGRTLTVTAWAEHVGLTRGCLAGRLRSGWTVHDALTTPCAPRISR